MKSTRTQSYLRLLGTEVLSSFRFLNVLIISCWQKEIVPNDKKVLNFIYKEATIQILKSSFTLYSANSGMSIRKGRISLFTRQIAKCGFRRGRVPTSTQQSTYSSLRDPKLYFYYSHIVKSIPTYNVAE